MQHTGDPEPGRPVEVLLQIVDHDRLAWVDAEPFACDGVDLARRFADADLRGDHHHVGERVEIETRIAVAPKGVRYQGNPDSSRPQVLDESHGVVVATQPGLHPRRQPLGLDHYAVRGQPLGETPIEGVGVDASAFVLDQKLSGRAVVAEQIQYQSRGSAEEFAELLERLQHTGGNDTAEVDQHGGARHLRGIGRTASGLDGGHACSYLSLVQTPGTSHFYTR